MVRKLNWIFFSRRRRTRQWKHVWQFCSLEWAKSRSFWRRIEQKSRLQPSCQPTAEQYRRRYIFFVFFVLPTKYNDADVPWWIQQWKASYTGTYYSWGKPLTFCLFFIYWVDHTRRQFYLKREILLYSLGWGVFIQPDKAISTISVQPKKNLPKSIFLTPTILSVKQYILNTTITLLSSYFLVL